MREGRLVTWVVVASLAALVPRSAAAQGIDTGKIDQALGRSGQRNGNIYKVGLPRTDLRVVVQGITLKPTFALGLWAAFSGADADGYVMGDLACCRTRSIPS